MRAERNGDTRADVVIHEVGASRGDEALCASSRLRRRKNTKTTATSLRAAEMFSTAASGKQQALLRACGLSISVSDALVGDVGAFAVACVDAKVAANGASTPTGSPKQKRAVKAAGRVGGVDDAATTALTLFGARGSKRSTLRVFPGGAPDGSDATVDEATLARETAWASLAIGESEQVVRGDPRRSRPDWRKSKRERVRVRRSIRLERGSHVLGDKRREPYRVHGGPERRRGDSEQLPG